MQAIILPRQAGKTTKLVQMAAERGGYIVCLTHKDAERIARLAQEYDLNILFPITLQEFLEGQRQRGSRIRELYFDDLDRILAAMAGGVPVVAFSMTNDRNEIVQDNP